MKYILLIVINILAINVDNDIGKLHIMFCYSGVKHYEYTNCLYSIHRYTSRISLKNELI